MTSLGAFSYRLMRATTLDSGVYEEVEADRSAGATVQAAAVVILSSVAAGIGASGWRGVRIDTIAAFSVIALVTWVTWAALVLQIGGRLAPESQTRTDIGELLRTIGFAASPGLLQVFAVFPGATTPVFVVTALWMLAAMVIAVRDALDYTTTGRALAVCAGAGALALLMAVALGLLFTRTAG